MDELFAQGGRTPPAPGPLDLQTPEIPPRDAPWIRGRIVLAERRLVAPVSGERCVGFRIASDSGHRVDDSELAAFEFETDEGERVRAEPGPAILDVPLPDAGAPSPEAAQRLDEFLRPRGISGVLLAREGILQTGDRVAVCGAVSVEPAPSAQSYRQSATVRTVRAGMVYPLAVRRL